MKGFLISVAAMAALSGQALANAPSEGRLAFEVLRNGHPFGRHEYQVLRTADGAEVRERARFRAQLGPLTVFRFEHDCAVRWRGEALERVECATLKDGRRTRVTGAREGAEIVVRDAEGDVSTFAADALPTQFLTQDLVKSGTYLDTETGRARAVRVTRLGRETIDVGGRAVAAERYRVEGTLRMELWYDDRGRWVQGAFTARGQRIEYRLASPLNAAPT